MPPHVQGDADCNETVDVSDILAVLHTLGGTSAAPCSGYADVNCDGIVNGLDAVIILRHVSQLPNTIPDCPPVGAAGV